MRATILLLLCIAPIAATAQEDPFKSTVRPTDPLSPKEELATFTVPEGFQVQLVASEPEILKPMNLAFDAKGRLWASMSQEYPYAAPADRPGRDCIKILEDTTGDGHADKITTFVDGLNIPIGLYPYRNGVIAWSIPNIWFFEDTDGDDQADKRTILYGPMGFERDTHGMNNAFTRDFDGWLHACHGFNNETMVNGADGHEISMSSGNTYRMRLHGERIEHFTWGQVNPFGMTLDPLGNLFSADCHSKPIYQLVREGYYPSFGKPDDGLGFIPPMMDHLHSSTAIAGVEFLSGDSYPEEYQGDMLSGNVMTSRINRNRIEQHGSTLKAIEQPDFLVSTDPWFRPVEIQLGPDGALYVADFYNRIIGHYEVPLDHAGRDRTSGRIWKISRKDHQSEPSDLTTMTTPQVIEQLTSPNLPRRLLATDYLSDTIGKDTVDPLKNTLANSESPEQIVHSLWVLFRLGETEQIDWLQYLSHSSSLVRLHAVQIVTARSEWTETDKRVISERLQDEDPFVIRAAVEGVGHHRVDPEVGKTLIELWNAAEADDPILVQTIKIALRNLCEEETFLNSFAEGSDSKEIQARIAEVCLGLKTAAGGEFLLSYLRKNPAVVVAQPQYVEHAVKTLPKQKKAATISLIREQLHDRHELQLQLFKSVEAGMGQQAARQSSEMIEWANELAEMLLASIGKLDALWEMARLPTNPGSESPWDLQTRTTHEGNKITVLSSFPRGERLTGSVTSHPFPAPATFRFVLCGHRGFPKEAPHNKNVVHLRHAITNEILRTAYPPRNDVAQPVEWDLSDLDEEYVVLEAVDGDTAGAFAWLAFGQFEPPVISVPKRSPAQVEKEMLAVANLVGDYRLTAYLERIKLFLSETSMDAVVNQAVVNAILKFEPNVILAALATILDHPEVSPRIKSGIYARVIESAPIEDHLFPAKSLQTILEEVVVTVPAAQQNEIAMELATSKAGAEELLGLIEKGKVSGRLLQSPAIFTRLEASGVSGLKSRTETLTKNLPSLKAELQKLIAERRERFSQAEKSAERGQIVFEKNCKSCHQIGGKGALVGPQLDGIGNRGLSRILEDTLDPNRNVDVAFHTTTIVMDDGKVLTGLFRREGGGNWILADNKGKEFSVAVDSIEESVKSPLSLMPENVAKEISEPDFFDLIEYLLNQTAKPEPANHSSK